MEGGLRWARASPSSYGGAMSFLNWNVNFQKRSAPISRGYKNQYASLLASLKTSEPKSIAELRAFLPEKRQILGISEPSSLLMLEIDQTLQAGARSEVSL